MNPTKKEPLWERCGDTTPRDRHNLMRLTWAFMIWALCFTGASQLIKRELLPAGPFPWLLAVLPTVAAVCVLLAYGRYLREADELQRKIQLQALAVGFGGTFFALSGYRVFERLGAPVAGVEDATMVAAVAYSIAIVVGSWCYR